MSLRSLLPLGRAFEPSTERSGRFRPAAPGLLPDFSREHGASRSDGRPGAAEVGGLEASSLSSSASALGSGVGVDAGRLPGGSRVSVSGTTPVATAATSTPAGASVAGKRVRVGWRLPSWLEQVLLLLLLRPGNRRRSTRSTQSEFCLRSVAVAKNDLVTSDVEVVVRMPAKPAALSASCRARLLALWWSPVARRFGRWGQRNARP